MLLLSKNKFFIEKEREFFFGEKEMRLSACAFFRKKEKDIYRHLCNNKI